MQRVPIFSLSDLAQFSSDSLAGFARDAGPGVAKERAAWERDALQVRAQLGAGGHALGARLGFEYAVGPEVGVGANSARGVGNGLLVGYEGARRL